MRLAIRHTTRYLYSQPVAHGLQRLRLRPKPTHGQQVLDWSMVLEGARVESEYDDHNHNHTALVSIEPGASVLSITCAGLVETVDRAGVLGPHTGHVPLWLFQQQTALTRPGARMRALAGSLQGGKADRLAMLHELSGAVLQAVRYEIGHTDVTTSAEEAFSAGRGVCQDHAHIFIGCARALGVPARYVSGYLMMDDRIDQEAGHGWAEAHVDGLGWVGFDVSNGISPDARYVRVASGCDYREAAPITGISFGAGEAALAVSLAVEQQIAEQ
ncbi:transglutaminase family protein [Novosphingobium sp. TH158]|uniref:transglutaminase family protein n=1 Tax=Novosphingobium sp. TH158 TaxID=2067455 RepID=UPI000C7E015D|nr:transglutaminase family protein [Novosphingobium sp. TH158]PLK25691.1 transglutaminase [Novosphingobium sp. TH158]